MRYEDLEYLPNSWRRLQPLWQKIKDVYEGLHHEDVRAKYLIQKQSEPDAAYRIRLRQSYLDNRVKPVINSHAGLLSEFRYVNVSDLILQYEQNIDLQGNSLKTFFLNADVMALRDGGCFIAVEQQTALDEDEQRRPRRPYLVLVDIRDVRAPVVEIENGVPILKQLIIRRAIQKGYDTQTQWWVYQPGTVTIYEEANGVVGLVRQTPLIAANGQPLTGIPIVFYSLSDCTLMEPAIPPFMTLCELNLRHMNKESELDDVESKCNTPTAYRKWPAGIPEAPPPFFTGTNRVIEVPKDGDVGFIEPRGTAIAITNERQKNREERMNREAKTFLTGSDVQRTATEALLEAGQAKMAVAGMAERKKSASQVVFDYWMQYADPAYQGDGGYIEIEESSLKVPPSAREIQVIFDGFVQGVYDRNVALAKLREIGWLPNDVFISEEIE